MYDSLVKKEERQTRLELATPTLARLCSTNWAIAALFTLPTSEEEETRTPTTQLSLPPQSSASTNSATSPLCSMWLFWIVSAQNRTRTCTSLNTRTWNVRVYQFRHLGKTRLAPLSIQNLERQTRLELATPTLARLCSTNWAIAASVISFRLLRSWKRLQR